jgi:hypothetical protein
MRTRTATELSWDGNLRGRADCRRAVETGLSPEHYGVATLANCRSEAVTQLTPHLNPDDLLRLNVERFDICVEPDRNLPVGAVLLGGAVK